MRRMLGALVLSLFAAAGAHAVDCDARISDGAGLLTGGRTAAAAQQLSDAGADVRVVTVTSLEGQGNLDNLFRKYLSECVSWRAGSGIKNNLVVLMLIVGERRSIGLYFDKNGAFGNLNSRWLDIQNSVKPQLKSNDFDGGLAAALGGIRNAAVVATQQSTPPQERATVTPPQAPVVVHTAPTDFSGLWVVLGVALGGGLVIWVLILLGRAYAHARDREEKRRSAQLKARNEKATVAAGITDFDGIIASMSEELQNALQLLGPADLGDLPAQTARAKALIRSASLAWSEVDQSLYNPDRDELSVSEYDGIRDFFAGINAMVREARSAASTITEALKRQQKLPQDAQRAKEAAEAAIDKAAKATADAEVAGYRTGIPAGLYAKAARMRQAADKKTEYRMYGDALAVYGEAASVAQSAREWCERIATRVSALQESIRQGTERTTKVAANIKEGREVFTALAAGFNRSSYESIHGNGTEALRELDIAVKALMTATEQSDTAHQEWDTAELSVTTATKAMDRADALIHAIHNRKKHLEKAKADAKAEVEAASADIIAAREYARANVRDVAAKHNAALDGAQRLLDEARVGLNAKWPDWPEIVKLAMEANDTADTVLNLARGEVEVAERQRKQAATNLREAQRARSKLREYINSHRSDISTKNRQKLEDVEARLKQAEDSSDLAFIIATTQSVANDANSTYSSAAHEVAAATPAPSYHYSGSSIGGGSSDFGSSSSSFDFGGGGDIGGGSSDF